MHNVLALWYLPSAVQLKGCFAGKSDVPCDLLETPSSTIQRRPRWLRRVPPRRSQKSLHKTFSSSLFSSADKPLMPACQATAASCLSASSICVASRAPKRKSPAPITPLTCAGVRTPTMAAVTAGLRSVHAIATSPGLRS